MSTVDTVSVTDVSEWQRAASRLLFPLRCRARGSEFSGRIAQREITPGLRVSRIETGPFAAERPASLIAEDAEDGVLVALQLRGQSTLRQRGRVATARAGTVTICEVGVPSRYEVSEPGQTIIALHLAPALAGLSGRLTARVSAVPIDMAVPGQAALQGLIEGVESPELTLGPDTGESLARAIGDLLALVVRAILAPHDQVRQRRFTQLAELRLSLREQLSDPELTVDQLAAQHYLSVRQVHTLFAEDSDTPAAYLRRTRLAHAERLLLLREHSGMTVNAISQASGYSDSAAFIRAFTRERGTSPARWAELRREPIRP
ncbi:helix-turn-helix transcriptional regulator [Leucobacter chromiireducens]|uniref:AraC family transcriptional regulator n=1 Tax=Leucobacter chromiireducens subsp. solipictus TaxID=398235 RepID=A0ABS1SG45_9MICO|nr:AraC family transcriptional regulator [Leucobacter chromiireducens]MBL3678464.1 AraC family transcriptional regulator [Leucobacter chromiireducens subsp. solipictus]